jgi:hypothetical protein
MRGDCCHSWCCGRPEAASQKAGRSGDGDEFPHAIPFESGAAARARRAHYQKMTIVVYQVLFVTVFAASGYEVVTNPDIGRERGPSWSAV